MLLSIGVPIFNGEKTIKRCLESLISQKGIDDYEIICVDDGSTDNSGAIVKEYAKRHDKIRLIQTENQGEYNARYEAIMAARGDWIGFVDCDDTVEDTMYRSMLSHINDRSVDMVVCGFKQIDIDGTEKKPQMTGFGNGFVNTEQDREIFCAINPSPCNKIFRAEVLRKAVRLKRGPRIISDVVLYASIAPYIRGIGFVNASPYLYYRNENAATGKIGLHDVKDAENSFLHLQRFYAERLDADALHLLTSLAVIHLGLSFTINCNDGKSSIHQVWRETTCFLSRVFPAWEKNSLLGWGSAVRNRQLLKAVVAYKLYRFPVWIIIAGAYRAFSRKMGLEMKW